jgi:hypothetical protein
MSCPPSYQSILRPLITYGYAAWGLSISAKKLQLQIFQSKILRITVDAPWYIRNKQLHRDLGIDSISAFIQNCTTKSLVNLQNVPGAVFYILRQHTLNRRLKQRLPQDHIDKIAF